MRRSERPKPPVKISKLDYQDTGADSGKISMSGVGNPNIRVLLFFDEQPLAEVVIGSNGTWALEVDKKVGEGEHTIRADTYDIDGHAGGTGNDPTRTRAAAVPGPGAAPATAQAEQLSGQPEPVYPAETAAAEASKPSGQPEPVYPDGPPRQGFDAPSTSVAAAPQDLSSQPQPVYRRGGDGGSRDGRGGARAAAEPAPAAPSQAVTAETPSEAKPAEQQRKAPVVFKSVDYQDTGADSGKVLLSGSGEPGTRIFLYIDETALGELSVGSDGGWTFEVDRKLGTGEHKFRADSIDESSRVGHR